MMNFLNLDKKAGVKTGSVDSWNPMVCRCRKKIISEEVMMKEKNNYEWNQKR